MSKRSSSVRLVQEISAPEYCTFSIFNAQEGQLTKMEEQGWKVQATACEFVTPSNDATQNHGKVRWVFLLVRS